MNTSTRIYPLGATFIFPLPHITSNGLFQKRSIPHPQRKFLPFGEGGGESSKEFLNLYRMSGEGEGVLLISSVGGEVDLFWNDPINIVWVGFHVNSSTLS